LRFGLVTILLLFVAAPASADEAVDLDAIPATGRPEGVPFSGASGRFKVEVAVDPPEWRGEEPLTLTLTVIADDPGRVRLPPQRLDLAQLDGFRGRFLVADPGEHTREPRKGKVWQFLYYLRPDPQADPPPHEVPSVPFAYYDPEIPSARPRLRFQVIYTDPVPLASRPVVRPLDVVPLVGPDFAFRTAPAAAVLARDADDGPPVWAVVLALLAPPLLGLAWFVAWRRLYPDAVHLAELRRRRAVRAALRALAVAARQPPVPQAAATAAAVVGFLSERFSVSACEPTPDEIAALLTRAGCAPELSETARDLFRACDAVRFGHAAAGDLIPRAEALILALEERACPPYSS
jgi:hypothetical protein